MKKLFFNLVLVCSFAVLATSCYRDDVVGPLLSEENPSHQEMRYTSCPVVNSSADYVTFDVPLATWRTYVMGANKLLRVKYTGPLDYTKTISFNTTTLSGSVKARMFAKTNNNVIAMSQCITVTSSSIIITSSTNVPLGTTEVWLEFYSDATVSAQYLRMAQ